MSDGVMKYGEKLRWCIECGSRGPKERSRFHRCLMSDDIWLILNLWMNHIPSHLFRMDTKGSRCWHPVGTILVVDEVEE